MNRVYLRTSTDTQDRDGFGDQAQLEEIKSYLKREHPNKEFVVYKDGGVSGTVPFEDRKQGAKLLSEMESGDFVIVRDVSRLGRTVYICSKFLYDADQAGVTLITAKDSSEIKGPSKRLMFFIFCALSENERLEILARTSAGVKVKKAIGGNVGGGIPFYMTKNPKKGGEYLPDPDGIELLGQMIAYFENPTITAAVFAESIGKSAPFISKHKKLFSDGTLLAEYEIYKTEGK